MLLVLSINTLQSQNLFRDLLVDHFCTWLEDVIVPIFKNDRNLVKFPQYVSDGNNFL